MPDLATLQTRIEEAETALHELMTGTRAVDITSPTGARTTYQQADAPKLQAYIAELKGQAAAKQSKPRGPITFVMPG